MVFLTDLVLSTTVWNSKKALLISTFFKKNIRLWIIFLAITSQGSWFTNQILKALYDEKDYKISPQDWIISEKSLATFGQTFNAKVITGNATAPPPSEVIPKKL